MKKVLVLLIGVSLVSCGLKQEKEIEDDSGNKVSENTVEPAKPEDTEFYEPIPPIVNPIGKNGVPSDAIVLFDGENLESWVQAKDGSPAKWHLNEDGSMTVKNKSGDIKTKQNFGSVQLHIEWKSPVDVEGENQHRANSGVFLQNRYEVQVLDNNHNNTYVNGQVGSIYKQSVPLVNASVPTGEWNTYDIIFHQPEFNEQGEIIKKATITVLQNGVLIQDHFEILGSTAYIGHPKYEKHGKAPLSLQDHGDNSRVSYRNIWIRAL
tara:strand:+ start:2267 stop:3061 length:795 start_codon:yes stop_codon:yes gene_type:complete